MSPASKHLRTPLALVLLLVALVSGASALTGCNTLRGAGEDVENAGHAVKHAVD